MTDWELILTMVGEKATTDISEGKLKKYVDEINLPYTNKKETLEKLELLSGGKLTNAAILFFGKNVLKEFKLLNLRCATFLGFDRGSKPLDMTDFEGDIFEMIDFAENYVLQHINVGMKLNGLKRIDVPEINMVAFREAIINAFCHRDYSIMHEITIAVYENCVEVQNPGGLIENLTIKDILSQRISRRRNPLVANILHRINYVEKWGTGIKKIFDLEPTVKLNEFSDFFSIEFLRNDVFNKKKTVEKTREKTRGKTREKMLSAIRLNQYITQNELASVVGLTIKGVEWNLKQLKEKGILRRIGSDRGGHWEII